MQHKIFCGSFPNQNQTGFCLVQKSNVTTKIQNTKFCILSAIYFTWKAKSEQVTKIFHPLAYISRSYEKKVKVDGFCKQFFFQVKFAENEELKTLTHVKMFV